MSISWSQRLPCYFSYTFTKYTPRNAVADATSTSLLTTNDMLTIKKARERGREGGRERGREGRKERRGMAGGGGGGGKKRKKKKKRGKN